MDYNLNVFLEALWGASILPFGSEATFAAMAAFGTFDMKIPALLALTGGVLGQLLNLTIGRVFLSLHHKGLLFVKQYWYDRIATLFNKYGTWLIVFSWVSILKLVLIFAGFLGTRTRFALPLILAGQVYHYWQYLF